MFFGSFQYDLVPGKSIVDCDLKTKANALGAVTIHSATSPNRHHWLIAGDSPAERLYVFETIPWNCPI